MALLHTLTDNFASQDAAKWTYTTGATATGGQCSIIPDSSFSRGITAVNNYDFTDSYLIFEVPQLGSSIVVTVNLSISTTGSGNEFSMYYESPVMKFREIVATVQDFTSLTYDSTLHRWWRIRTSPVGTFVYWDTSRNGYQWINQRSKAWAISAITDMKLQVIAYTTSGTTPALLDNFNLPARAKDTKQTIPNPAMRRAAYY